MFNIFSWLKKMWFNQELKEKIEVFNDGFLPQDPKPEDWEFGSDNTILGKSVLQADGNWLKKDILKERQRKGLETMGCVSWSLNNALEYIAKAKYGTEENFSDRFLAKLSNTTTSGNNFQTVCETRRKDGTVKEQSWPYPEDIVSWSEFYKAIPKEVILEGQSSLNKYKFYHEWIDMTDWPAVENALKYSPIQIGVFAWAQNSKGEYYFPQGARHNHATLLVTPNKQVFDSYEPFIKQLSAGHPVYRWGKIFDIQKIMADSPEAKLFERVKGKLIILPEKHGEVYRVNEDHLQKVTFAISDKKLFEKVHTVLRENKAFLGLSNENFDLLLKHIDKVKGDADEIIIDDQLLGSLYLGK